MEIKYRYLTLEDSLAAVHQNPENLNWVKDQTPEICMAAVTQDGAVLYYARIQTPELRMAAVMSSYKALGCVEFEDQTPELCMAAVTYDGRALQDVGKQTLDICIVAVRDKPGMIDQIRDVAMRQATVEAIAINVHLDVILQSFGSNIAHFSPATLVHMRHAMGNFSKAVIDAHIQKNPDSIPDSDQETESGTAPQPM